MKQFDHLDHESAQIIRIILIFVFNVVDFNFQLIDVHTYNARNTCYMLNIIYSPFVIHSFVLTVRENNQLLNFFYCSRLLIVIIFYITFFSLSLFLIIASCGRVYISIMLHTFMCFYYSFDLISKSRHLFFFILRFCMNYYR